MAPSTPPNQLSRADNPWEELFPRGPALDDSLTVRMREVRKGGRPLLLLSADQRTAQAGISLYAAQTKVALLAKEMLRLLFRCRLGFVFQHVDLKVNAADSLVRFLQKVSGQADLLHFSVLAGNPAVAGRRFMIVVSQAEPEPPMVVKTGVSSTARDHVRRELSVLRWANGRALKGIPKLCGEEENERTSSFATEFIQGDSPPPGQQHEIGPLLASWIESNETLRVGSDENWRTLAELARAHPALKSLNSSLSDLHLSAALQHGDFAPWNIKVKKPGEWHVLDWERGRTGGLPAWDWFHYVTQSAILVSRLPSMDLLRVVEAMLSSAEFRSYAVKAGLTGNERKWFQAYLLYVVFVLRPTEGFQANALLLNGFRP